MDTRFGIHTPSDYNWIPGNLIAWCEHARRHGINWITLWANCRVQVEFAKALTDHGIRIIYRPGENKIPSQFIGGDYEQYRRAGAEFCQFYNEPNLKGEWNKDIPWNTAPEKFAELWAQRCKDLKAIGFIPVVPPLSPGGEFWHPDFFTRMLRWWKNQGMLPDLLRGCVLGIHNRPITNPPDDTGMCSFEGYRYYRQRMQEIMGFTLPMVAPEAGYEPQWVNYDWQRWQDWNLELIRRFQPAHPKYVGADFLCHIFWIYDDLNSTWDHCSLVNNWRYGQDHSGDTTTNLWRALEAENWGTVPEPPIPVPGPSPTPTPSPGPQPEVPMGIEYVGLSEEMKERLFVIPADNLSQPYWKIVKVEVQPDTDNFSAFAILPAGTHIAAEFSWPDGGMTAMPKADLYAPEGAKEWAASMPMFNPWGPYRVEIQGNSERLDGFGLYGADLDIRYKGHRPVLVYFQLTEGDEPEPEPPIPPVPPSPPPPPPVGYEFGAALNVRVRAAGLPALVDLRDEIETEYARLSLVGTRSREVADRAETYLSIDLHHTVATGPLNVLELAKYHWKPEAQGGRGYDIIAYHLVIDEAGKVTWAKRFMRWSAQSNSVWVNRTGIAVALQGNFVTGTPKDAQLKALRCIIEEIEVWVGEAEGKPHPLPILPHNAITDTECPGRLYEEYVDWRRL